MSLLFKLKILQTGTKPHQDGILVLESIKMRALYPAGEFVWTGFDYIGEPTPWNQRQGRSPTKSYFGIVDTAGFAKDDYFLKIFILIRILSDIFLT